MLRLGAGGESSWWRIQLLTFYFVVWLCKNARRVYSDYDVNSHAKLLSWEILSFKKRMYSLLLQLYSKGYIQYTVFFSLWVYSSE